MTGSVTCLYCKGSDLVRDPQRPHWIICATCNPIHAAAIRRMGRLTSLDALANFAANDLRGRPTIGGSRSA